MQLGQPGIHTGILDSLADVPQHLLGIPETHLADGCTDARLGGIKGILCRIVRNDVHDPVGFAAGQVDDPGALVRCKTQFGCGDFLNGVIDFVQDLKIGLAAHGVPLHGIQTLLFLGEHLPGVAGNRSVAGFVGGVIGHVREPQILVLNGCEFFRKGFGEGFLAAQGLNHEPGARLGAVFVVAVFAEGIDHGHDIIGNVTGIYMFGHFHAEAGDIAKPAGGIDVEGPVFTGHKSQVAESRVGFVGIAPGECDLEFAGHLRSVNEVHEELRRGFGPGQHIKGFPGVHSGEGRTHDVAGIVSTAAIADNVHIQGVVHDGIYLFRHQVMQLHGLAGGEVHQGHLLFIQGADQEIQLVFRQTAGRSMWRWPSRWA